MADALAPCPFCGRVTIEVWESDVGGTYATAMCRDCHACGPEGRSVQEATTAWNTRARAEDRREADTASREKDREVTDAE
jgi:Lar family restriction alleviation protein